MSWLRLDADYAQDGTLRRCRAVMWWPLILCALKRGGGVASADDIAPDVLADLGQGDEDAAARAVEKLKAAGLLVEVDGGWTTPKWSNLQPDPTASDRAKRYRDRNKAASDEAASRTVTVTHRDVTIGDRDATADNGPSRLTYIQDIHTGHTPDVVDDTSRARPVEPPRLTTTPPIPDRLHDVCEAFRRTQSGRMAMMLPPATVGLLSDMTAEHGAAVVLEAIRRACERCRGDLTIAYLRPVVAAVIAGEPEQRPKEDQFGRRGAAYRAENGCASPEICEDPLG